MRDRATRIALVFLSSPRSRSPSTTSIGRWPTRRGPLLRDLARDGAERRLDHTRLNGLKYFEKPPLQYWATAAAFKAFGASDITARLYTGLCGLLTILLVGYTARRLWSGEHAIAAMMALASSPYFMALGGIVTLDMGLTLWTTLTLCAFLLAEGASGDPRERRRWLLVAWAGAALAVLSKGLVGIVFPAATFFVYTVARHGLRGLRDLEWIRGAALFFLIAAPWFVAVSMANKEFAEFFFVHEHFQRFLTTEHRRTEPWWYFLPIAFAGFLPWMFALPSALAHALEREAGMRDFRPLTFAMLWAAFIVLFFSASGSKLPAYVLPAFPALALVLGRYLVEAPTRRLAWMVSPLAIVAIALGAAAWYAPQRAKDAWTRSLYDEAQVYMLLATCALLVAAVAGTWALARGRRMLAIVLVAFGTVVAVERLEDAYEEMSPRQSGLAVAEKMRPWLTPATRLYSVRHYEQSVPFYIDRTMTLVEYYDEFALGIQSEPGRIVEKLAQFPGEWQQSGDALAIMQPDLYEKLKAQGLPMQLLHADSRRVLVRKP
jgi:4-amino-4-deoxy-L-arabinose transferase-like glycosyltransferase